MIESTKISAPVCMALGFFDSVHMGHRQIVGQVVDYAHSHGLKSAVFTFCNNAYKQFNLLSKLIYTYEERLTLFDSLGVDYVASYRFDKQFKSTDREEFLTNLISDINVKCFVCGYDYMFGAGGRGDVDFLQDFCDNKGIILKVMPQIKIDNERVSSTLVKSLLNDGNVDKANKLLGESYFMLGNVIEGRGVGRVYDMPTANLNFISEKMIIKHGVYATYAVVDGVRYKAVTSIGSKPTFNEMQVTVESFLSGFDGDLYGKKLKLEFVRYLRDIVKFSSPEELKKQVYLDMEW